MCRGFTLIEILVSISIIATLAGLVVGLVSRSQFQAQKFECTNNVRNLVVLLESLDGSRFPAYDGSAVLHYLVRRGEIAGEDSLSWLFCPGDLETSLADVGGADALKSLDPGEFADAVSYAARAFKEPGCRARKGGNQPVVLIADDSDDHHDGRGFVVGLSGGAVKWREKFDRYGLAKDEPLAVGADSPVEELRCLRD